MSLIDWASWATVGGVKVSDYLIHIPNEAKRSKAAGARAKRMGLKVGVSDLFLAVPAGGFSGLWIELKAPATAGHRAGKPTQAQLDWLDRMAAAGYCTCLCWGWMAAKSAIEDYLGAVHSVPNREGGG